MTPAWDLELDFAARGTSTRKQDIRNARVTMPCLALDRWLSFDLKNKKQNKTEKQTKKITLGSPPVPLLEMNSYVRHPIVVKAGA